MKIAIFGGTGKTGLAVIKQAVDHGHEVTVMVRTPEKLPTLSKPITVIKGDFSQIDQVHATIKGQDAVICTLGSRELYKNTGFRTMGTRTIVQSMQAQGVKRFVVMSSMGIGESWNHIPLFTKALFKIFMPAARADHEEQEQLVKASQLEWTIIRPSGLTDTPGVTAYEFAPQLAPKTSRISRANVADLILKVIESRSHIHEAITISN